MIQPAAQTQTVHRPWILNPDLVNKSYIARSAPATTGIDNRNNAEQVFIANPTAGEYTITVAHSGGLSGGAAPSAQWVSVITSGDIPLQPTFHSADAISAGFISDPGAYLTVEYTTDIRDPQSWVSDGTLITGNSTNWILPSLSPSTTFIRLLRVTP